MIRQIALLLCSVAALPAAPIVLYDGSLNTNPGSQGWIMLALGLGSHSESVSGGAAVMRTTGQERAVYGISSPFSLDGDLGYRFTFDLQLDSESHSSTDRAGLSLVIVGDDLRGLEIAFWTNQVWVQNDSPIFTHGESAAYDTTQRTLYTLTVRGGDYSLSAGVQPLLSGNLRDYSAGGLPYTMANSVFLGDDTYSAIATTRFYHADATNLPEPATWSWAAAGLLAILAFRIAPRRPGRVSSNM